MLLFSQHTTLAEHALPLPTPTTVSGEQSSPMRRFVSCRTTPSKPRRAAPAGELACPSRSKAES